MIELLLKYKVNPTRRTWHMLSRLVPAVRHGHEEVVKVQYYSATIQPVNLFPWEGLGEATTRYGNC